MMTEMNSQNISFPLNNVVGHARANKPDTCVDLQRKEQTEFVTSVNVTSYLCLLMIIFFKTETHDVPFKGQRTQISDSGVCCSHPDRFYTIQPVESQCNTDGLVGIRHHLADNKPVYAFAGTLEKQ